MRDTEIHVWCQQCWESIALPRVHEFAVGVVSIKMIEAVIERQEFKEFARRNPNPGDIQAAIVRFLDRLNPACCLLGAEKVKAIIDSFPLKESGGGNTQQQ